MTTQEILQVEEERNVWLRLQVDQIRQQQDAVRRLDNVLHENSELEREITRAQP